MNPKIKKIIIASGLGLVSIALLAAYLQLEKLKNYVIKFKRIKINKVAYNLFNFDLFLNFENKSDFNFAITSQKYNVYINNVFVTKIENSLPIQIKAKAVNVIGLNVQFNPKDILNKLGVNLLSLVAHTDKINIKIDIKMKVKWKLFSFDVPFIYEDNLKSMMASKNEA